MQILDHIAREHAECTEFFSRDAAGFLVQKCAEYGGFGSVQTLCEKCNDNACQNVSTSAFCHALVCDWDDVNISFGRGYVGGGAF